MVIMGREITVRDIVFSLLFAIYIEKSFIMKLKLLPYFLLTLSLCLPHQAGAAPDSKSRTLITSANIINTNQNRYPLIFSWMTVQGTGLGPGAPMTPYNYGKGMRAYGIAYQYHEIQPSNSIDIKYWVIDTANTPYVTIEPNDLWGDLAAKFAAKYGSSGTKTLSVMSTINNGKNFASYVKACAAAVYQINPSALLLEETGHILVDNETCSKVQTAPTPTTCDIAGANEIAHGIVNISDVNGYSTKINATVTCSAQATVGFRIVNQRINLGNGISSQLLVNNSLTPENIRVATNTPVNVTIESKLEATAPEPGSISGSSIIIVEIQ